MREEPTTSEKAFYDEHGFLSVSEFLQPDELADWRAKVDTAVTNRRDQRLSFASEDAMNIASQATSKEEQDYYDSVFTQRVNLWQTDKAFRDLLFQEPLGSFVGKLAGVDGLRVWHDQALIKEPYGSPTSFHLDVPYWSFTSADAITIWIALDDATVENGCLCYVPGSHKAKKFDNVAIGHAIGALFDVYPEWRDVKAVPCPVPAGGAVLHNGLTFHGAGANMTPGRRRAITCAYMPDGATFNGQRNVLPDEYLATLKVGDVLNNEAQNPLVYSRSRG
ncbi:MAG: phytanoyl-CoA dioxygenase family protein [Acidimicrobiales bacterium]|jgi:phytanoyl-CoA hydroxylase